MKIDHPLIGAYEACMSTYEESRKLRQGGRGVFAKQLRQTRSVLGMTCRELGFAIGVTGQLISQIETTAKSILNRDQVQKIVDLCLKEKLRSEQNQDLKNAEESSSL